MSPGDKDYYQSDPSKLLWTEVWILIIYQNFHIEFKCQ